MTWFSATTVSVDLFQLEGNLPKSLINCKALQLVNMESNKIKDVFPTWLGSLPSLLFSSSDQMSSMGGGIITMCSLDFRVLRVIDISHNDFTGTLPPYQLAWNDHFEGRRRPLHGRYHQRFCLLFCFRDLAINYVSRKINGSEVLLDPTILGKSDKAGDTRLIA